MEQLIEQLKEMNKTLKQIDEKLDKMEVNSWRIDDRLGRVMGDGGSTYINIRDGWRE
jgi:DNA-binding protein YbaB